MSTLFDSFHFGWTNSPLCEQCAGRVVPGTNSPRRTVRGRIDRGRNVPKPGVRQGCGMLADLFNLILVFSFRILSLLLLPLIILNHAISATRSLLSSSFLSVQYSNPYINTGNTSAQHSFILALSDMLFCPPHLIKFP